MSAFDVLGEAGVTIAECGAGLSADDVAGLVADDGGNRRKYQQGNDVEFSGCGQNTGRHQKGISRQKESEEKPCFNEDDRCNAEDASPGYEPLNVQELIEDIHHWVARVARGYGLITFV